MRPVLFYLPLPGGAELPVPAYGALLVVGLLAAVWVSGRHGGRLGLDRGNVFDLGCVTVAGGVLGAHLLHLAVHWEQYGELVASGGAVELLKIWQGGLVYYGGLAGGALGMYLYARRKRIVYLELLDFAAPLGALATGFTRVGCFLNGCCYGRPTGSVVGVVFPVGSAAQIKQASVGLVGAAQAPLAVHATQLYEAAASVALFALLWWLYPRRRFTGQGFWTFILFYAMWRFAVELLRADAPAWQPAETGLTVYQWISLAVAGVAALGWLTARRRARLPATSGE